jgi:hypothetical protein
MSDQDHNRPLARLRRLPPPERVAALAATLPHCDEREREPLGAALLDLAVQGLTEPPPTLPARWSPRRILRRRHAEHALLALARTWIHLPPSIRAAAVACATDRLPTLADRLSRSEDQGHRRAAAAICRDWLTPLTLTAAGRLLFDAEAAVAAEAEATLDDAVRRRDELGEAGEDALDALLAEAGRRYADHRRRGVMFSVAIGAEAPGPRLGAWLADDSDPALMALRAAVRKADEPGVRARCVAWLGREALAPAAIDRLERPADAPEHASCMLRAHLLLAPARRRRLSRIRRTERYVPPAQQWGQMPAEARRMGLHWIDALPLRARDRAVLYAETLSDPDPGVRARGVRRLVDLADQGFTEEAMPLLGDFAFDEDERVARYAAGAVIDLGGSEGDEGGVGAFRRALTRSPHASVRALAMHEETQTAPMRTPEAAVEGLMEAPGAAGRGPAAMWTRRERARVVRHLRSAARDEPPLRRVAALLSADRLSLLPELEVEILAAADDPDERVAATGARLLASLHGDACAHAMERCLSHQDARVRANALEGALARGFEIKPSAVRAGVEDASARVRSIAASALLSRDASDQVGFETLVDLLRAEDAAARSAALWAIERVGAVRLANRVADLTRSDPDDGVRSRARRTARALLGAMGATGGSA